MRETGETGPSLIASHSDECQNNSLEPNCCEITPVQLYVEKFAAGIFVETFLAVTPAKRLQTLIFFKLSRCVYCAHLFRLFIFLVLTQCIVLLQKVNNFEFDFFFRAINL